MSHNIRYLLTSHLQTLTMIEFGLVIEFFVARVKVAVAAISDDKVVDILFVAHCICEDV